MRLPSPPPPLPPFPLTRVYFLRPVVCLGALAVLGPWVKPPTTWTWLLLSRQAGRYLTFAVWLERDLFISIRGRCDCFLLSGRPAVRNCTSLAHNTFKVYDDPTPCLLTSCKGLLSSSRTNYRNKEPDLPRCITLIIITHNHSVRL